MLFTKKYIANFLQDLKNEQREQKPNPLKGSLLNHIIQVYFDIKQTGKFIDDLEREGYIYHNPATDIYFISRKGHFLIYRQNLISFVKHPILRFVLILGGILITIIANWDKIKDLLQKLFA